jgi:formylmethanofuran--tetrahydromethanopterin N-formyltransferase
MDGEFLCEETFGTMKGVAGGNLIVMGADPAGTLEATESAVAAIRRDCRDVILPFPGGIARSGSKVGSKYKGLRASTNTAFSPTLRGVVTSELPPAAHCTYEIVIDGLYLEAVERATAVGVRAAASHSTVLGVTAGNYGGSLGPFHIRLLDVLERFPATP